MPAILRDVPLGRHWGWYSREDPRMHLQSIDRKHKYKVWLEHQGTRVFNPLGDIPAKVAKTLKTAVAEDRQRIEDNWVDLMLDNGWIELHLALPHLTLVAYPNTPSKLTRKINLIDWFSQDQVATLTPETITLDRELAALRLWADRKERRVPYDVRLSSILWTGQ